MRSPSILAIALLAIGMMPAMAAEKPAEIDQIIQSSAPYGSGELRRMLMSIYDADLWTDANPWSWEQPFALTLHYHFSCDGADLAARSIAEMNRQSALSARQTTDYTAQLNKLFPDVKDGDEITALYLPETGTRFFHNGEPTGTIMDKIFTKRFLSIWLDPRTSEPALRRHLLALPETPTGDTP